MLSSPLHVTDDFAGVETTVHRTLVVTLMMRLCRATYRRAHQCKVVSVQTTPPNEQRFRIKMCKRNGKTKKLFAAVSIGEVAVHSAKRGRHALCFAGSLAYNGSTILSATAVQGTNLLDNGLQNTIEWLEIPLYEYVWRGHTRNIQLP